MATDSASKYWALWTLACGGGEFLGIGAAAAIAFLLLPFLGDPQTVPQGVLLTAVMVLAGTIEGVTTGSPQWVVLRERFVRLRSRNWLAVTALGAATAWLLGMPSSTFFSPDASMTASAMDFSIWQAALLGAVFGAVLGALSGDFQWVELHHGHGKLTVRVACARQVHP